MEVIKINTNNSIKNEQSQVTTIASTSGLGIRFENDVQTAFAILMLANGFSPGLPSWPIKKILLQGRYEGYQTDDLIVFCENPFSKKEVKLLSQIKHSISIRNSNKEFQKVIQNAWLDFNNPQIFSESSKDAFALICGPLSTNDTNDVRSLFEDARISINSMDFIRKIEQSNTISKNKRYKYRVFKDQLKKANNDIEITNDVLWRFLKTFNLLIYDLDIAGVIKPIFQTLIDQFCPYKSDEIWSSVNRCVQTTCNNGGYIDTSRIPDEVVNFFKKRQIERIPEDFTLKPSRSIIDLDKTPELLAANLLGAWNDENDYDRMIVSSLALKDYLVWIGSLQKIVNQQNSPVQYKNRIWSITDRELLWKNLLPLVFDEKLDLYQKLAIDVLSEKDPKFELPAENRFTANLSGKSLKYSYKLRTGIAETLALLTSFSSSLENCTNQKGINVSAFVVRDLLFDADWTIWASLDVQLPLLAESSPDTFLSAVKNCLMRDPCPFDALFQQEGKEITGCNYITGLLWALEELAWEEEYFGLTIDILGNLANRDPGGSWANRPINSLSTIFLPWLPQTTASIERRKIAVQSLEKKFPEVAWLLILSLLPQRNQISMGSHRYKWRKTDSSINEKVSNKTYQEQVTIYADMAVDMAKNNIKRLLELIVQFDNLPPLALNKMMEYLSSDEIEILTEEEKATLWKSLTTCLINFKQNTDEEEVSNSDIYQQIEQITKKIEPEDPIKQTSYLFVENETELYENFDDFETQGKLIIKKRQDALRLIIEKKGINELLGMIKTVDSPSVLGNTLSGIADQAIDKMILPAFLDMDDRDYEQFASSYVWKKYFQAGWDGIDILDKTSWSADQIVKFYLYLPFCSEVWERIESESGEIESLYWNKVPARLYKEEKSEYAIDKFIKYNRPYEAIACLCRDIYNKKPFDIPRSVEALKLVMKTSEPNIHHTDTLHLKELIRKVQEHMNEVDPKDMFQIEWYFMPYMSHSHGLIPRYINKLLAQDPNFFVKIINYAFKPKSMLDKEVEMTEKEKVIALNAWRLLEQWHTPPGLNDNNEFDSNTLKSWINTVKEDTRKSERFEIALYHIGQVLYNSPPDPTGFFINLSVAEELNKDEIDEMRNGFYFAEINSRGVHYVDPSGKPERDLAEQYRQKSKDADNLGFCLFAQTLRNLAKHYEREADENSVRFGKGD